MPVLQVTDLDVAGSASMVRPSFWRRIWDARKAKR